MEPIFKNIKVVVRSGKWSFTSLRHFSPTNNTFPISMKIWCCYADEFDTIYSNFCDLTANFKDIYSLRIMSCYTYTTISTAITKDKQLCKITIQSNLTKNNAVEPIRPLVWEILLSSMNLTNFNGQIIIDACVKGIDRNSSCVGNWTREYHLPFHRRCCHQTIHTFADSSSSRCFRFFFDDVNADISVVKQLGIGISEENCQIPNWYSKSEKATHTISMLGTSFWLFWI